MLASFSSELMDNINDIESFQQDTPIEEIVSELFALVFTTEVYR